MSGPAHRSVSNIRPSITGGQTSATGPPGSPHTPLRAISSNFASPSTLRAEEDCVVIELGSRFVRAGFAGDALPKASISFGPEHQRRAGDYRQWQAGYDASWRNRGLIREWGDDYELWKLDLKNVDLGLVGDKIERIIREAFSRYLLIDSRPRRMALVLPTTLPQPLLSTILDTMFNSFQPPTISLMSAPVLTTIAAGLRSALVVDIGWVETVITGIYEYREVNSRRTIRASKLLCQEMLKLLGTAISGTRQGRHVNSREGDEREYQKLISFEECEEVMARMAWCMPFKSKSSAPKASEALPSVREEDELEASMQTLNLTVKNPESVSIPLNSTQPPMTLSLPFSKLSVPCECALFANGINSVELDDEELPVHFLAYETLLHLPVDVRSISMSRIIFTGGMSNLPGLKNRILDELQTLVEERNWDPVQGRAVEQLRHNRSLRPYRSKQGNGGPVAVLGLNQTPSQHSTNPAFENQEPDLVEEKIKREVKKVTRPSVQGVLRAVESMGSWAGGSILSQLKVPAVSVVEREQWLQSGIAGASKSAEMSNIHQRQSMGPGGLRAAAGDRSSWTLGPWG